MYHELPRNIVAVRSRTGFWACARAPAPKMSAAPTASAANARTTFPDFLNMTSLLFFPPRSSGISPGAGPR